MLYSIVKNVLKIFYKLVFRYKVEGLENIPAQGGAVICANHKSNNDAVLITLCVRRKLSFIAKEELFRFLPLGAFFKALGAFPVKRGSGDIGAVRKAIEILKNEGILVMFPEGTRNKSDELLLEFKNGVSLIAYKAGCPIIPCVISGNYKPFSKMKISFLKPVDMVFEEKPDLNMITSNIRFNIENELKGYVQ